MNHRFAAFLVVLSLVIGFGLTGAQAQNQSLEQIMKQMGQSFKTLNLGLVKKEPIPLDTLKAAAAKLTLLSIESSQILPSILVDENGQPKAGSEEDIIKYQALMNDLIAASRELEVALAQSDLALAEVILKTKLNPTRNDGHDQFRP